MHDIIKMILKQLVSLRLIAVYILWNKSLLCKKRNGQSKTTSCCPLLMTRKVILVVAFDFFIKNFGRWQGLLNAILSFYDCRLSGGDTQRGHSEVVETLKSYLL